MVFTSRSVHFAHAPGAEGRLDLVSAEGGTGWWRRGHGLTLAAHAGVPCAATEEPENRP